MRTNYNSVYNLFLFFYIAMDCTRKVRLCENFVRVVFLKLLFGFDYTIGKLYIYKGDGLFYSIKKKMNIFYLARDEK